MEILCFRAVQALTQVFIIITHSNKHHTMALLQNLLHRGIIMLCNHYKEYFKTSFYVLEWGENTDTQISNGPGFPASLF